MSTASQTLDERTRKNESTILRALASAGLSAIALATDVNESTVSRWQGTDIPRFSKALAAMGLKVVPAEARCYQKDQIEAILTLARASLERTRSADALLWEDPE